MTLGGLLLGDGLAGLADHEPVLRRAAHSGEGPAAPELVAAEFDLQAASFELRQGRLGLRGAVAPMVPDDHRSGPVVVPRYHSLEVGILEGVVLHMDRQAPHLGPDRWSLGYRPALEHSVHLQTDVVVEAPSGMLLDDE